MQDALRQLVLDMRTHYYESPQSLELFFAQRLQGYPRAEIIAAVFGVNQSSVAQKLLVKLPDFINGTLFSDLSDAFQMLKADELAVYHYRDCLAEVFGIDVEVMSNGEIRSNSRPSVWSLEYLSDHHIDQQELLARMQQQDAPMIDATHERQEALQIAAVFGKRQGYQTHIGPNTRALWYDAFEFVDGPAWLIEAPLPPSNFEGSDTLTYVVSADEKCVKYIINASGFPHFPNGPTYAFTPEEIEELRQMGFILIE